MPGDQNVNDMMKKMKGIDESFIKNNASDIKKFAQSEQGKKLLAQLQKSTGNNPSQANFADSATLDRLLQNPSELINAISNSDLPEPIKKLLRG